MAERLKAHAWNACIGESLSWVRIPLSPPVKSRTCEAFRRPSTKYALSFSEFKHTKNENPVAFSQAEYDAPLKRLTTEKWRRKRGQKG